MTWQDHVLRLLARGVRAPDGQPLQPDIVVAVLDRIEADPGLSARLDALGEDEVHVRFLELYEAERAATQ